MSLREEIELNRPFESRQEEALLALMWTHQCIIKAGAEFFAQYQLTDTRFNALMIIADYQAEGVTQADLARRLLINRASSGSLVDGMEKMGWIERHSTPGDRRSYQLVLTDAGSELLAAIKPRYYQLLHQAMGALTAKEVSQLTTGLNRLRHSFVAALESMSHAHGDR